MPSTGDWSVPDEFGTPEMFDIPAGRRQVVSCKQGVIWRRWSSKNDPGCQTCKQEIADGQRRHAAMPARYVRIDGADKLYICYEHYERMREQEVGHG
jgi:hypothetical protein